MSRETLIRGTGNRLIDGLPKDLAARLAFLAESLDVSRGDTVYRQNSPAAYVYFPVTAVYSQVVQLNDGRQIEAASIGNEGMLGLHVVLGLEFSPIMAVSRVPGKALRVPVPVLMETVRQDDCFHRLLSRYAAYRLQSTHQTVACNTTHSAEERICRWLVMTHDQVGADKFALTHESLAQALGVRRQTVTLVARTLQAAGFINYQRGIVRILDRQGLERVSCECYAANRAAYDSIVRNGRAHTPAS